MKWLNSLVLKFAAKKVGKKLGLEGGPMDSEKKWYKSKNVLTGIVTVLVGTYEGTRAYVAPQVGWNLPEIPGLLFTILGALGIYTRMTASATLTK